MRYLNLGNLLCGLGLILLTAWTGYSDAVDLRNIQEDASVPAGALTSERIGQTLVAHQPRLHALEVRWIVPAGFQPIAGARVTLHLRRSTRDEPDLATASVPLAELANNQFAKFVFPALQDSNERPFYFFFEITPAAVQRGSLSLWASGQDAYPDGQMTVQGRPVDRDLVFRAYYEPDLPMLLSDLTKMLGEYGGGIVLALLLLLIPGILLAPLQQEVTAPLVLGAGLAVLSALSLFLLFFRIDNPIALALIAALLLASAAIRWRSGALTRVTGGLASLLWLVPAFLSLCVGLLQIRDLGVPLWVDSYTHAQWIQVLLSEGQLPASNFYHFGYHALTALLARLAGMAVPQAMLLMGPLLITQVGSSVLLLSRRLSGSLVAGLASAIGVWFLSPTPSYLITWGRYPLLLGAALLPIALLAVVDWIDQPRFHLPALGWAVVTFAGLAFAHARLTVFYFVFVVVYLAYALYHSPHRERRVLLWRLGTLLLMGLGVGALWLAFVLLRGVEPRVLLAENVGGPSTDVATAIAVSLRHHGPELILLSLAAAVAGLVRRSKTTILSLLWYAILYLIAALPKSDWVGALISPDLVILMSFVPVALIVGDGLSYLYARLGGVDSIKQRLIWGITGAIVLLIGARDLVSIVNPATVQFSSADEQAMGWIRKDTPQEAKFLVNSFNWYGSAFVPADGGAWIPYLTGRPIYFMDGPSALAASNPEQLARWIAARRIGYVYLGMRSGILHQADLACRPDLYEPVYHEDGVEIYRVRAPGANDLPNPAPAGCSERGELMLAPGG